MYSFKDINKKLQRILESIALNYGGNNLDYNNYNKIYRSVQYYENNGRIEVHIWLYEQNQKYNFQLYSPKLIFLWENQLKKTFKAYNPKVFSFEASGNMNIVKIEFSISEINASIDNEIYSLLEEALSHDTEIMEKAKQENIYPEGKRIQYEDDNVIVYNPVGEEIYNGIEDYEPMKNEKWQWDRAHGYYTLNGYVKVCSI